MDLKKLIDELVQLPNETQWVEFKHNNYDPYIIGKNICALANSATLYEKNHAYMIWGIDNSTHEIVGTKYDLQSLKKGNQELENWLRSLLSKNIEFEFNKVIINNLNVGVLTINRATNYTVSFEKVEYIRIGSYTKKLNEHPTIQSQLWDKIRNLRFEEQFVERDLELQEALRRINYSIYFDIMKIPIPNDVTGISHYMIEEGIIAKQDNALFSITNLGAILLSKNLNDFTKISRKNIRVVQYQGVNRLDMLKENNNSKGYVVGFDELINFIEALTPTQEVINGAKRNKISSYPSIAIREVIANALIHQDFSMKGTGPLVEVFQNRIEVTNPGILLIDIKRIVDNPPQSRNEKLASLMRRLRMCEEAGTGWDKIVISCELMRLPAPKIDLYSDSTKVTLFTEKSFSNLSLNDKLWACYLHACIKHVQSEQLTNTSLRERFGLKETSSGSVSRLIKEALDRKLIKPLDPTTAPRYMKYVPFWA